ncbi:MAG TPA: hypothetical protein DCY03_32600, partial [Planctomycetaceae bacterium]|nr:hypothetical protein [Planctomycetaceae bacterium]
MGYLLENAFCKFWLLMEGLLSLIPSASDLRERRGGVNRGQKKTGWRYRLTGSRCEAVRGWCRDDAVRCAATR